MRIVIPGGSGFLGQAIARFFTERGDSVVVLTRSPQQGRESEEVAWDGRSLGEWADVIDGSDVVINLAGRNVNCRYTPENRREIMESRVASTRVLGQAIAAARNPPSLWLQSSTATIYAHRFDAPNDEATGIIGGNEPDAPDNWRFSIEVARAWERELDKADTPATRKVAMRTAVVMGTDPSGPFAILKRLARFGLGGPVGSGNQYVSWLHIDDLCRSLLWLIEHPELSGAINLAAPQPVTNRELMRELRGALGVPIGLPAPTPLLKIGTLLLGTEPELVLKSRRVVPTIMLESGFVFDFPEWAAAARALIGS